MTPNSRLAFVGSATLDSIALVPDFPQGDQRAVADALEQAGGGPAATAAVAAARLGHRPVFVGAVGHDREGERIIADLEAEGVEVHPVRPAHARSGASVILVHADSGARAIATRPVPPLRLDDDSPAAEVVREADWVHVDHLGWKPVRDALSGGGRRPSLSVDAGNPIDGFTPLGVDLYVPTVPALEAVYGHRPVDQLLSSALNDGARTVVATRGSHGSIAASADGRYAEVPAYRAAVVSTLGAGDAFHGALLAAIAYDMPLEDGLRYANAVAGVACTGLDGRSAIPDHEAATVAGATIPAAKETQ